MEDDTTIYRAKLTNLGFKSGVQIALLGTFILFATTLGPILLLLSLDVSEMVFPFVGIGGSMFIGLPLIIYFVSRPRYLTFDGTILTGRRLFYTVKKQVNPTGHEIRVWKIGAGGSVYAQTYLCPIINVSCVNGYLPIGCNDGASRWHQKLKNDKRKPLMPAFTVKRKDFYALYEALGMKNE